MCYLKWRPRPQDLPKYKKAKFQRAQSTKLYLMWSAPALASWTQNGNFAFTYNAENKSQKRLICVEQGSRWVYFAVSIASNLWNFYSLSLSMYGFVVIWTIYAMPFQWNYYLFNFLFPACEVMYISLWLAVE